MKPTQAQIEAAAKALKDADPIKGVDSYYEILANDALTAAAQVGDNEVSYSEKELVEIINANIERCAQVAETWKNGGSTESGGIAAAIRNLKDAP